MQMFPQVLDIAMVVEWIVEGRRMRLRIVVVVVVMVLKI
jgi:ribosomal protein S5